jgi:hypothetical protein
MGMFQVMRDVLVHQSAKIKLNTEPVAELAIRTLFAHFDEEIAQEFIDKYVPSGQLKVIAPQAVRYEKKNIYLKYKGHMRGYSRIYHNLDYVETYRGIAHIVNDRIIRDNYWVVNGVVSDNHPLDVIKKIGCEYTDLFNLREIHSDLSHYHMIVYNMIPVINPNNYNRVCDAIKKTYNVEPYLLICAESSEFYDAFFATIEARKATLRKQGIIPTI